MAEHRHQRWLRRRRALRTARQLIGAHGHYNAGPYNLAAVTFGVSAAIGAAVIGADGPLIAATAIGVAGVGVAATIALTTFRRTPAISARDRRAQFDTTFDALSEPDIAAVAGELYDVIASNHSSPQAAMAAAGALDALEEHVLTHRANVTNLAAVEYAHREKYKRRKVQHTGRQHELGPVANWAARSLAAVRGPSPVAQRIEALSNDALAAALWCNQPSSDRRNIQLGAALDAAFDATDAFELAAALRDAGADDIATALLADNSCDNATVHTLATDLARHGEPQQNDHQLNTTTS